jgi:hypothetical protein
LELRITSYFYSFPVAANVVTVAATRVAADPTGDVTVSLAVKAFVAALQVPYAVWHPPSQKSAVPPHQPFVEPTRKMSDHGTLATKSLDIQQSPKPLPGQIQPLLFWTVPQVPSGEILDGILQRPKSNRHPAPQ